MVLPVPGLPRNTRCRDMGGTGRPASSRRRRTFTRLIRLFTSRFTWSSPHSPSSSASSSSRVGSDSGRGVSSCSAVGTASAGGWAGAGTWVTNSSALRAGRSPLRPSRSHRASSVSEQALTKPASASLTTPSTEAKSRRSRVSWSAKRRASVVPFRRS